MSKLPSLLSNSRGTAAIEFALASVFLFAIIMVALDFGFYAQQNMRLGYAIEQGAVLAYDRQTGADTSMIRTYVAAAAGTNTQPTVTVGCNGTGACGDGKCSCINADGTGFTVVANCNAACAGSSAVSGNYMKIQATVPYNSVIVPDKWLGGTNITSAVVVRLQ